MVLGGDESKDCKGICMSDESEFKLTHAESNSSLWIKLRDHMNERLADHRRRNDAKLNAEDTASVRGQIKELKVLLELDKPEPAYVAEHGYDE